MWPTLARSLRRGRPSFRSVTSLSEHSVDGDVGSASPISGPSTWRGVARFYKTTEAVACPSGGGWRVLVAVGAASGAVTALLVKLLPFMPFR